jgi:lipoprotein NlpD
MVSHLPRALIAAGCCIASLAMALSLTGCGLLSWQEGGPRRTSSRYRAPPAAGEYVVQPGDTLYSIAFRNQLDYHDLANWNGIGRDYLILPGQRLRLTPPRQMVLRAPMPPASSQPPSPAPPVATAPTPAVPAAPPSTAAAGDNVGGWRWPTQGTVVHRFNPDDGAKGIDIAAPPGQLVVAAAPGKVVYSGSALKGYGELIIIKHSERYLSAYGYNHRRLVQEGQEVAAGQAIAEVGYGPEQKPMLHFEIRDRGKPVDPLSMLPAH